MDIDRLKYASGAWLRRRQESAFVASAEVVAKVHPFVRFLERVSVYRIHTLEELEDAY